eukprot:gnl/MRDRNA2_/MRDRNA2_68125_c0_seq1.p1 gnl/MRDRNA2_/MRDRNA2_68125_c0~~gnl/MRDRNA2_/MRDRNA2_68125_c0_seq1.p1  ORF type:complete len:377 (+),score=60.44 gnl/MRDRNA2_/MRDRNA2_68125_c0_seq1:114-1133(+)
MSAGSCILNIKELGFPFQTEDPFLFAVYHDDLYPPGDDKMGPKGGTKGHSIGADFGNPAGWNMYHGKDVPGFPRHPHRGFETVTVVRHGVIDHTDSLGCCGRFGGGDVQWMTAGAGICHCEMFPLLNTSDKNRLELFQIWLNLPKAKKMANPHFKMLWNEKIPQLKPAGGVELSLIAGSMVGVESPLPPPPDSWAAQSENEVAIWTLRLAPGSMYELPPCQSNNGVRRTVYFFKGSVAAVGGKEFKKNCAVEVKASVPCGLQNPGKEPIEFLVLQGRPIGEPVVQHGPFVMNDRAGIQQAFADYQRDEFGGWPHRSDGPVHDRAQGRFAQYADGRVDKP